MWLPRERNQRIACGDICRFILPGKLKHVRLSKEHNIIFAQYFMELAVREFKGEIVIDIPIHNLHEIGISVPSRSLPGDARIVAVRTRRGPAVATAAFLMITSAAPGWSNRGCWSSITPIAVGSRDGTSIVMNN
jgi:hypothetical protein